MAQVVSFVNLIQTRGAWKASYSTCIIKEMYKNNLIYYCKIIYPSVLCKKVLELVKKDYNLFSFIMSLDKVT